jgi:hypothetical protein
MSLRPVSIAELRRLTGFTWEELVRLLNVNRRSVHFWASGNKMTAANEEHLHRLLRVIRSVDRGTATTNRSVLLAAESDGRTPFDELANGRYEEALVIAGRGSPPPVARRLTISPSAKLSRSPPAPEDLVAGSQERVHQEPGSARAGKSVRTESEA